MRFGVVGINYKVTPVAIRERLAFADSQLPEALRTLADDYAVEGVILSTCNRIEVYAVAGGNVSGSPQFRRFLADFHGVPAEVVEPYLYCYEHEAAIRHLCRVAAGLDSMVLGEPQILGQVRDAFEIAERHQATGSVLSYIFRSALRLGKRARTETDIGRHAVSVSYAAVELARKIFGELADCCVLVVGAGEMGKLAAKTLVDNGIRRIIVANRTQSRAEQLAVGFGGEVVPFAELPLALAAADIVITSTDAPGHIIGTEAVREAMRHRRRPLFLVDIAVPRDVDPAVQGIDGVYLYNVDDLQVVCEANRAVRFKEVARVETLIDAELARFADWWQTLEVLPTVADLRNQAERIRQTELARALGKIGPLSERDEYVLDAMTQAIVNKLLHLPTTRLKQHDPEGATSGRRTEYVRVLRHLFGLDEATP